MKMVLESGKPGQLLLTMEYSLDNLDKVRSIQGSSWDKEAKKWLIPDNEANRKKILQCFPPDDIDDRTKPNRGETSIITGEKRVSAERVLQKLEQALKLKGYSSKTINVYLGHMKRYLEFTSFFPQQSFTKGMIERYSMQLLEEKNASHSYVNQALSAIKFYMRCDGYADDTNLDILRPRKEKKLP